MSTTLNTAEKLGYPVDTKLLIIHADDAGLSHSENRATIQSLQNGFVNSYSIMVPCPWFYEMAQFAKNNPHYDYGVHLTLTCEWENYKFGPVLPVSEVPSLVDEFGHFYPKRELLSIHATQEDVEKELTAQIEIALKYGLHPSHIDSHMYSVGARQDFYQVYRKLGQKYQLPILTSEQLMDMVGLDVNQNKFQGDLMMDKVHFGRYEYFEKGRLADYFKNIYHELIPGLNIILIHPAFDDEEMKGITVNHPNFGSTWRQIAFEAFTDHENLARFTASGAHLITWKEIHERLYNEQTKST